MFRRLLVLSTLLAGALGLSLATATTAAAAPEDVAISAPGLDGDDATPLIAGTADPTFPVHLFIDEVEVAELTVTDEGTWQHQVAEPLPRGTTISISARVLDESGTITLGRTDSSYLVWPEPLTVSITTPADGSTVTSTIELAGEWSTPDDGLVLTIDRQPTETRLTSVGGEPGSWVVHLNNHGLSEGPHTFQITGADLVGRPIASNVVTLVVDTTGPAAPVVTSPVPGSTVRSLDFVFEGTGTAGNQIELIFASSGFAASQTVSVGVDGRWTAPINDDPSQPGNSSLWAGLASRTLELYVVETDADGNSTFVEYSFMLDLGQPSAPPAEVEPTDDTPDASTAPVAEVTASRSPAPPAELAATGPGDVRLSLIGLLGLALVLGGLALRRAAASVG
jgi:hypothetical protein